MQLHATAAELLSVIMKKEKIKKRRLLLRAMTADWIQMEVKNQIKGLNSFPLTDRDTGKRKMFSCCYPLSAPQNCTSDVHIKMWGGGGNIIHCCFTVWQHNMTITITFPSPVAAVLYLTQKLFVWNMFHWMHCVILTCFFSPDCRQILWPSSCMLFFSSLLWEPAMTAASPTPFNGKLLCCRVADATVHVH